MRNLTSEEIQLIKTSIKQKGITSAEILSEVYDHYLTHLENQPEDAFKENLLELDEKFTYGFCKKLEADQKKSVRKEINSMEKEIFKSYFTWPRFAFTLFFIGSISYLGTLLPFKTQVILFTMVPLVFIVGLNVVIMFRTRSKLKPLKKDFSDQSLKITSSTSDYLNMQTHWPITLTNVLLHLPRIFGLTDFIPEYLYSFLSVSACILLVFYGLILFEVFKEKSKTAFV